MLRTDSLTATGVEVIVVPREGAPMPVGPNLDVSFVPASAPSAVFSLDASTLHGGLSFSEAVGETPWVPDLSGLTIIEPDDVEDLILLVRFSI